MKKFLLTVVGIIWGCQLAVAATQDPYCIVPPYITLNTKPHINIVLDVSGSMQQPAYMPSCNRTLDVASTPLPNTTNPTSGGRVSGCATQASLAAAERYNPATDYYGYFNSALYYRYNSANSYFEDNTASCGAYTNRKGGTNCLSGNLLNWIVTTRADSVRKILTGGRVKSTTTTHAVLESDGALYTFTDPDLQCTFQLTSVNNGTATIVNFSSSPAYLVKRTLTITNSGTCAVGTLTASTTNVLVPLAQTTGVIQRLYTQADLTLLVFGESSADYRVAKGQPLSSYVNIFNSENAYGATPTGLAMAQSKYFFQQSTSLTASNQTVVRNLGSYLKDPYYVSDGAGGSVAAPCVKSFNLLVSDGTWSNLLSSEPSTDTANDPVQHVHSMRKDDLRNVTALPGKQNVTTYTVYAYGDGDNKPWGRNSMIALAAFGGYDDKDASGWPWPWTKLPQDSRRDNNLNSTYQPVQWALDQCNPAGTWDARCAEWDRDKKGLPYNFFEGSDGALLDQQINQAVNDILGKVSSGTAASILGNNDNNGATLLQALFFPEKQFEATTKSTWLGELQSFWYYLDPLLANITIREDTVKDNKLTLIQDRIAEFIFDGANVDVNTYVDTNADGVKDSTTPSATETIDSVSAIWKAGELLWKRASSDRLIYANDPSVSSNTRVLFNSANLAKFTPYLDVASDTTTAANVLAFTRGDYVTGYRDRRVTISDTTVTPIVSNTYVWKLGDIINSTPKMMSRGRLNNYAAVYRDKSYESLLDVKYYSNDSVPTLYEGYRSRGVAFVGANDGMLHAFKLGVNYTGTGGYVAELKNYDGTAANDLGKELWAFIPKNAIPYLKHLTLTNYRHLYYVDATPTLIDAAIGLTKYNNSGSILTCSAADYYDCPKVTTVNTYASTTKYASYDISSSPTDGKSAGTSWRTVLIGGMGLGGASRDSTATCTDCVKSPISGLGYSSYFALDVTKQDDPQLLWEFGSPLLGYSNVGSAVVRIKSATDTGAPVAKNGKWFTILASGPSGPIDTGTMQFKALSDQPLRIFVLDLRSGAVVRTFSNENVTALSGLPANTHTYVAGMPSLAFAGSLSNATIDTDQWDIFSRPGSYSDDVVYVGYTRKDVTAGSSSLNKFAKGGVLRVLTGDNPDPATWKVSTVIDGIGPVTSAIAKLQDKTNGKLWLYFGTGRYYYKMGSTVDEDYGATQRLSLFGVVEPCYNVTGNDLDNVNCVSTVTEGSLANQTTFNSSATASAGWKIDLAAETTAHKAQRVITDPVATTTGIVFFTTFKPTVDVCGYGGDSSLFAVSYNNAGPPSAKLQGQALIQLSTGAFQQVDLSSSFTDSGGRESTTFKGVPPKSPPAITANTDHFPSKRVLHIMER